MKQLLLGAMLLFLSLPGLYSAEELSAGLHQDTVKVFLPETNEIQEIPLLLQVYAAEINDSALIFTSWVKDNRVGLRNRPHWQTFIVNGVIYLVKGQGNKLLVYDTYGDNNTPAFKNLNFKYWERVVHYLLAKYADEGEIVNTEMPLDDSKIFRFFPAVRFTLIEKKSRGTETSFSYRINK